MGTVKCNHPAVTAAFWAGTRRLVLCRNCYAWANRVAGAMGFGLVTDELRDGETACTQNVQPERALTASGTEQGQRGGEG